jgi:hypothetical protein
LWPYGSVLLPGLRTRVQLTATTFPAEWTMSAGPIRS